MLDQLALIALAGDIDTNGVLTWMLTKIVPIVFGVLGVGIILSARKGRLSDSMNTVAISLVGVAMIVGSGLLIAFGRGLVNLFIS
jgi:hypothetical protein